MLNRLQTTKRLNRWKPILGLSIILLLVSACAVDLPGIGNNTNDQTSTTDQPVTENEQPAPADAPVAAQAEQMESGESQAKKPTIVEAPTELAALEIANSSQLREAITADGVRAHLLKFQEIADANDGLRTSGTPGYDASAAYVQEQLEAAGYAVTIQRFEFPFFHDQTVLEQITPEQITYPSFRNFATLTFSEAGEVTAPIQAVDIAIPPPAAGTTSGCETEDFADFVAGNIALLQRGTCPFFDKAQNAEAAGAVAVLVFNEGQPDRQDVVRGTLGEPGITIPVVGLSFELGEYLYNLSMSEEVTMHVNASLIAEERETVNVIAETTTGRDDAVVVVGAHLDSVPTGPGIQDNGSGSATILEIALQMAELGIEPTNKVRFAFWGAEEFGLVGSRYYVDQLSFQETRNIALNLNFDMIASPNYTRFVYDGDRTRFRGADGPLPPRGSGTIEQVFQDYFAEQGLALAETPFSGRSDYGPFIRAGIPAGGLFTGAEEFKPSSEAVEYGGEADTAYDSCYHLACDTVDNVNLQSLSEMSDAAAHAVLVFAMTNQQVDEVAE